MSDYTVTTDFSVKDALAAGDSEKLIIGSDFDVEFDAIATMSATKYDSGDLASQAQAEAEASNTVLMTPLRLANWADENGGLVGEIQELADPNADGLVGWDDGAGAGSNVIFFTAGTGLGFATTTIEMSHLGFEDLTDPGGDRIAFWDDGASKFDWLVANTALTITGTNIDLDHLGFEDLADPGADRVAFWDDSASKFDWLVANDGLSVTTTNLNIDIPNTTELVEGVAYNDEILVSDGGTLKRVDAAAFQAVQVATADTGAAYTSVIGDACGLVTLSDGGAITCTIPLEAAVAYPDGTWIVFQQIGAGTVTIAHAGTLNSPGAVVTIGAQWGRVVAHRTAADVWSLNGDLG